MSPDLTWLQGTALTTVSVAATMSLVSVILGLFSVITGRDHLPWRIRYLLRRVPASAEDHRLHGMGLMLNGAALMLVMFGVAAGTAGRHLGGFPSQVQFFVTAVAFVGSMALLAGAYTVSVRVRTVSTRASTDAHPGIPPG